MKNTDNVDYQSVPQSLPVLKFSLTAEQDKLLVPLFLLGKFYHPTYGEVEYTYQDYLDVKNNLHSDRLGFKPYITHGHVHSSSDSDKYVEQVKLEALSTDAQLKRGEFVDVLIKDNVVYGLATDLNPDTKQFIESGQYEFASGEFIKNFTDKTTGENVGTVMFRTALTNAPFMPFKDKKLQLLSTDADKSLQTDTCFVVKLQQDENLSDIVMPDIEEMDVKTEEQPVVEETTVAAEEPAVSVQEESAPVVEEEAVETEEEPAVLSELDEQSDPEPVAEFVAVKTEEVLPVENEPLTSESDSNKMMQEIDAIKQEFTSQLAALKEAYDIQRKALEDATKTQVQSLNSTIEELTAKLTQQENLAHQFSMTMAEKAKKERYNRMASQGVAPALIEKFSTLEAALTGASIQGKVLKFSTTDGGSEDVAILDSIEELLVEASRTKANVSIHRFGQSEFESDSLVAELKAIASRAV